VSDVALKAWRGASSYALVSLISSIRKMFRMNALAANVTRNAAARQTGEGRQLQAALRQARAK
jgi:hypothetical protein